MNRATILDIEDKAVIFRNENGYGADAPIPLRSLLLKKNIITIFKPLSDKLDGMAILARNNIRFLMINRKHSIGKQHFTIGHELYHLFIQENFDSQKCNTELFELEKDIEERKADYFAACLLLPEKGVIQLIPNNERNTKNLISDATIFKIQHYYRVSVKAVIYRLVELGFVDKSYFETFKNDKKSIAKKLGYDMSLFEERAEDEILGNYAELAIRLNKEKKISETQFIKLMADINIDPFETCEDEQD